MHRSRLLALAALSLALPLLLAACGGDGDDDSSQITDVIESSATSNDPANCTELQTQAFTEQTEFSSGEAAIKSCEKNAGDDPAAESVEVDNIEVDGDSATADVSFTGGSLGGQAIALSLVKDGDQWKLDSLDEFTSFDKQAFAEGILAGAGGDTPKAVLDCVEQQINNTSEADLESIYLSGEQGRLLGLFGRCFQGG